MKELDPPPLHNYIDPATVDNIVDKRRKPAQHTAPKNNANAAKEHKERIEKMKELYGLFVKMEEHELPGPGGRHSHNETTYLGQT